MQEDNNITIKELAPSRHKDWDAYVDAHAQGTFFHLSGWRDVFAKALGHKTHYLYAEYDGRIVGILPLVHIKSLLFGNSMSSLPFSTYAGALAETGEIRTQLEQQAHAIGEGLKVGSIEYRCRQPIARDSSHIKLLYECYFKPILPTEEANMQAIRGKQRNIIRKGGKNGLEIRTEKVDGFYPAYSESVRNLGTPVFPKRLFQAIHAAFPDNTGFLSACLDDKVISSAMNFYYKGEVCPYYWGGTWAARRLNGNDFLFWGILCGAMEKGCTVFNFGRSKKGTGSAQWKRNLGFEPEQLYYAYDLIRDTAIPELNPQNPKYRYFIAAWKRLPLPLTEMIGPHLSINLG